jgi:hypothetical protein
MVSCQTSQENKVVLESQTVAKDSELSVLKKEEVKTDEPLVNHKDTFPLTFIASNETENIFDGKIEKNLQIGTSEAKFFAMVSDDREDSKVFLSGKDLAGKTWQVEFDSSSIGLGYGTYEADFDNNGIKDFLFINYTSSNGFLPTSIFHFVMFEKDGRPFPFFVPISEADIQKSSIYPLMDTDKDRKAELVVQTYQYSEDGDKWKGHYITNVYQAENARWKKLDKFQNKKLPVYTFFETYQKNFQYGVLIPISEKPKQKTKPFSPNWENFSPVLQAEKISLIDKKDFDFSVKAVTGNVSKTIERKGYIVERKGYDDCYEQTILVSDTSEKRKIQFISEYNGSRSQEKLNQLLPKIKKIKFFGNCSPNKISPYLIWIQE